MTYLKKTVSKLGLLMVFSLTACGWSNKLPVEQYLSFIEKDDADLARLVNRKDFDFVVQYRPAEYIVLKEFLKRQALPGKQEFADELREANTITHMRLKIAGKTQTDFLKEKVSSEEDYYNRINYFSNELPVDISLSIGQKVLPLQYCHFERTFGVERFSTVLLGFTSNNLTSESFSPADSLVLNWNGSVLGTEPIQASFSLKQINELPSLQLQ